MSFRNNDEPVEGVDVVVDVRRGPLLNGRPVIDGVCIKLPNDLVHIERGPEWSEVACSLEVAKKLLDAMQQCAVNTVALGKLDYIVKSMPHGDKLY